MDKCYDRLGMSENPEAARDLHALMTKTYDTLLRNKKLQLRAVEIRKFVWKFTDPYESQSFHDFLSHVEHFTLSVRGGNNGAGCVNTCGGYLKCVARFDELFFDHLASATTLTFRAFYEAPIGLDGWRHARLALRKEQILSCLEIRPYNAPFIIEEEYKNHSFLLQTERIEPENVQQIRHVLNADPRRRVFGYATLDDKYGDCTMDEDNNPAAFERGEDQVAFDRLMGNVNANAAKGKKNPVGK